MHHVQLYTMSHPVYNLLLGASAPEARPTAKMLASFRRALNLVVGDAIVALVTPELGNGPFHMVVNPLPPPLKGDRHPIWREAEILHIGPWALHHTHGIHIWEPQPNWREIRIGIGQRRCLYHAIESEIRQKLTTSTLSRESCLSQLARCSRLLEKAVVSVDLADVSAAAAALCGLGPGLTPSGDDYLAGVMLALWAGHHRQRDGLCHAILEGVVGCTNRLSEALLAAAARGEANEPWHVLLSALGMASGAGKADRGDDKADLRIDRAVNKIGTYGATSGLDMLLGFEAGLNWCGTAAA